MKFLLFSLYLKSSGFTFCITLYGILLSLDLTVAYVVHIGTK